MALSKIKTNSITANANANLALTAASLQISGNLMTNGANTTTIYYNSDGTGFLQQQFGNVIKGSPTSGMGYRTLAILGGGTGAYANLCSTWYCNSSGRAYAAIDSDIDNGLGLWVNTDTSGGWLRAQTISRGNTTAGYITNINPAFEAKGQSQNIDNNTGWRKIPYQTSVNQRGTAYSSTNSRFTAPITGWYQFNAQFSIENGGDTDGTFSFAIDGNPDSNKGTVSMPNTGTGFDGHLLSACMNLNAGQYVEVWHYTTVATQTRANNWQGWFSGFLIG